MRNKKILMVFGTRPEAIKMAPLFHQFKKDKNFQINVCSTGQHREMLDQVMNLFNIKAKYDLNIMRPNQDLSSLTYRVIEKTDEIYKKYKPDLVFVHGDTTTTMAASISAFYNNISVAHVEAGLRTNDLLAPFPEEFNRQVVSRIAELNFAPTKTSRSNLLKENVNSNKIFVTGNTVIDSLHLALKKIKGSRSLMKKVENNLSDLLDFDINHHQYILITGHRRENFGDGFKDICEALKDSALKFKKIKFIYPVHLNPNVKRPVSKILSNLDNFYLIPPLDYETFLVLLEKSYFVITDSGGIQEEAPSLGKPVLVMRNVTERPEAVKSGTVKLVGSNKKKIIKNIQELINNSAIHKKMSKSHNPYGDGKACERILTATKNFLK
jgi:UDP-N-acetylglucosamine 2-epimerase (non-hydrolysing)